MSGFAFGLVMFAAVLHASWNAMVKAVSDRGLVLAAVSLAHCALGLVLILTSPSPSIESWICIFLSTIIHFGYYVFLFQSYKLGDLSQVYPISRGLAPALVSFGAYIMLGETLGLMGWIGLLGVTFGIALLAFQRGPINAPKGAIPVAAMNGVLIASYSVVDGIGVRLSDSPFGYMGWLFLLEIPVSVFILTRRYRAGIGFNPRIFMIGLAGGVAATAAYGMAIYAKSIAPLGAVSAIRESSVIIAALIGLFLLGERPWQPRIISAVIVAAGVAALAFST